MRRTRWATTASALAGGLLVLGLAACSTDAGGPSDDVTIPPLLARDIGDAQADEVDQSVAGLWLGSAAVAFATGRPSFSGAAGSTAPRGFGCATVDNTTDTDGDGTPDEATYTFALPACHSTGFRGGTLDITGTVVLSDPTPTSADFAHRLELDDFRHKFTSPDGTRSFTATRNGTRTRTATATSASLSNTVTTVRSVTGRPDATISHNTMLTFTPDAGKTLARGEPLPSGTFVKSGTLSWSRGARSFTFTVTTVVPLRWDATCTTDRKIASGEIRWALSDGSYIKTVWNGCGNEPTREFVRAG